MCKDTKIVVKLQTFRRKFFFALRFSSCTLHHPKWEIEQKKSVIASQQNAPAKCWLVCHVSMIYDEPLQPCQDGTLAPTSRTWEGCRIACPACM